MQDVLSRLTRMRRPALLMRAARIGAGEYRRERALPRLYGLESLPGPIEALTRLIELEDWHDECRRAGDAAYSAVRHVDTMIALLGEARLLAESRVPREVPALALR